MHSFLLRITCFEQASGWEEEKDCLRFSIAMETLGLEPQIQGSLLATSAGPHSLLVLLNVAGMLSQSASAITDLNFASKHARRKRCEAPTSADCNSFPVGLRCASSSNSSRMAGQPESWDQSPRALPCGFVLELLLQCRLECGRQAMTVSCHLHPCTRNELPRRAKSLDQPARKACLRQAMSAPKLLPSVTELTPEGPDRCSVLKMNRVLFLWIVPSPYASVCFNFSAPTSTSCESPATRAPK